MPYYCKQCGSTNLEFDASAWQDDDGNFELLYVHDRTTCVSCGHVMDRGAPWAEPLPDESGDDAARRVFEEGRA